MLLFCIDTSYSRHLAHYFIASKQLAISICNDCAASVAMLTSLRWTLSDTKRVAIGCFLGSKPRSVFFEPAPWSLYLLSLF